MFLDYFNMIIYIYIYIYIYILMYFLMKNILNPHHYHKFQVLTRVIKNFDFFMYLI